MPALATASRPEMNRAPAIVANRSAAAAEGVATMERLGVVVTVAREQTLFVEGDPAECYFKVVKGAIRSCKLLADGRRHIGDFFLPGDFIGLDAVEDYAFTAEAVAPTTLIRYARRKVDALAEHDPRVAKSFVEIMRASLLAAHDRMTLLGRMSAMERIASFLINLADRSKDARIELPMTRTDIGDYLGLTMETVSRAFSQLKHDGVIQQCGAHEVAIADRDALEALADAA